MKNNRHLKSFIAVALIVAVSFISIAYATYEANLTIKGNITAKNSADAWNVVFQDKNGAGSLTGTTGGSAATATEPTLSGTSISGFQVNFFAPGDSITYEFKVKNLGSSTAKLDSVTLGKLTCSVAAGSSATSEEATALCNELSFSLTKSDGDAVTTGLLLAQNESLDLKLSVTWSSTGTASLSGDVAVDVSESSFKFTQSVQ